METAGFVVGVAGLTALFSACVQGWGYVSKAQSFAHDFAVQQTKLDVEKTLFLQWGMRVGIVGSDRDRSEIDPRLTDDNGETQQAAISILMCLKQLLTNSEALSLKYGIVTVDATTPEHLEQDSERVSRNLMETFESWQNRIRAQQSEIRVWKKARWACRDKDKFAAFINEINYFVEGLRRLMPINHFLQQLMVRQAVEALRNDLPALHLVRNAVKGWHEDWSDAATDQIIASEGLTNGTDYADNGTETGTRDFEMIREWQQQLTSNLNESQPLQKRPVDQGLLESVDDAVSSVQAFQSTLSESSDLSYITVANSNICSEVRLKVELLRTDLKAREFTPKQYEKLEAGLMSWVKQVKSTAVKVKRAGRRGFFSSLIAGSTEMQSQALTSDIKGLETTLAFIISKAQEAS